MLVLFGHQLAGRQGRFYGSYRSIQTPRLDAVEFAGEYCNLNNVISKVEWSLLWAQRLERRCYRPCAKKRSPSDWDSSVLGTYLLFAHRKTENILQAQ